MHRGLILRAGINVYPSHRATLFIADLIGTLGVTPRIGEGVDSARAIAEQVAKELALQDSVRQGRGTNFTFGKIWDGYFDDPDDSDRAYDGTVINFAGKAEYDTNDLPYGDVPYSPAIMQTFEAEEATKAAAEVAALAAGIAMVSGAGCLALPRRFRSILTSQETHVPTVSARSA